MSNNGSQHLAALTLDEETAPLVNLVPDVLPGDLYKFVADHVWNYLDECVQKLPKGRKEELEEIIEILADIKAEINTATKNSPRQQELVAALNEFKRVYAKDIDEAAPLFWSKITDSKHRRKIVKR